MEDLQKPLTLKSGLILPNRLSKAAMAEQMALNDRNLPLKPFETAYAKWAEGGWGMVQTGNVLVDPAYLGMLNEVAIPETMNEEATQAFKTWADVCSANGTPTFVQLNHAGRQSQFGAGKRSFFTKTIAPSAIPLNVGSGIIPFIARTVIFGTPRAMNNEDIERVIGQFAHSARVVAEAGFAGVVLHGAHGYLLSLFLSSRNNQRADEWGGDALKRAKIVVRIIKEIRKTTPKGFGLGIKLNSADHQKEQDVEDTMTQIGAIVEAGIDFIEISGGSWEDPQMMASDNTPSESTKAREAFFLTFAKSVRARYPDVHLMVTGGFRTRAGMAAALRSGDCDLVGIGRPAVLDPALPKTTVFNSEKDDDEKLYTHKLDKSWAESLTGSKSVGGGMETAWYSNQIREGLGEVESK